jgi:hypothetical protein
VVAARAAKVGFESTAARAQHRERTVAQTATADTTAATATADTTAIVIDAGAATAATVASASVGMPRATNTRGAGALALVALHVTHERRLGVLGSSKAVIGRRVN